MKDQNIIMFYGRKSKNEKNKIFVTEEDFQIGFGKESFGTPLNELSKIEKEKINGKTLYELFSYHDSSLWWFIQPSIYPEFKKLINFIEKFFEFIENQKPCKIIIQKDFEKFDIIKQICNKNQIKLGYSSKDYLIFKIKLKITNFIQPYRFKKISHRKIQKRKKIFNSKFKSIPSTNEKIIFAVPNAYRRATQNYKTGKTEKKEFLLEEIIKLIDKKSFVGVDLDYTFKGKPEVLSDRINSSFPWFPIELIMNDKKKSRDRIDFLIMYKQIISNSYFQNLFQFKGISLWPSLEFTFKKMNFHPYLQYYLLLLDSINQFFNVEKPKAIFLFYETGPLALAFILAAAKFRIKTVGVAHATIDEHNPMYSFTTLKNSDEPYGFPIPDVTLVHGSFSKETLVKQGYPKDQFEIFGNPVYFNLNEIRSILSTKKLYEKFKIKQNQKVIMLASEYLTENHPSYGKYNYNSQMWRKLLENFGNSNEFQIILKPHPNENTSTYERILKEMNVDNAKILQGDLFELVNISSVVIAVFSNVMTDALCLEKPVIRVKFDNVGHTVPYDKFGVVVSTDLDGMVSEIHKILENEDYRKNLKRNLAQFLKEQNNIPSDNPELILKKILK